MGPNEFIYNMDAIFCFLCEFITKEILNLMFSFLCVFVFHKGKLRMIMYLLCDYKQNVEQKFE